MKVVLNNISKQYKREWIFKNISLELNSGEHLVVLGANGSGKSTLLKLIAGAMLPTEGEITYSANEINLLSTSENVYEHLTIAAPYMELIEDYTLKEHIEFHFHFKNKFEGLELSKIPEIIGLENSSDKQLKYFSSGMKQRVRLGLAILSNTPLLLLDEPCSNLDKAGIEWYQQLIGKYTANRTVIVCSNHLIHEHSFCKRELSIGDSL